MRLNPTKTEVVWLGASQHVSRINNSDIPMLSTSIKVAESARDLGVIPDAELTMSAHVTALCRSGRILSTETVTSISPVPHYGSCQNTSSGVHILLSGLLQLVSVRSDRQRHEESPVVAECRSTPHHRSQTS